MSSISMLVLKGSFLSKRDMKQMNILNVHYILFIHDKCAYVSVDEDIFMNL